MVVLWGGLEAVLDFYSFLLGYLWINVHLCVCVCVGGCLIQFKFAVIVDMLVVLCCEA